MNLEEAEALAQTGDDGMDDIYWKHKMIACVRDLVKQIRQRDMALAAYRQRDEADWKRNNNPGVKDDFDAEALQFLRTFWEEDQI